MNSIRQGLTDHRIPFYVEEILTHHFCPYFVRMTIVRQDDSYSFNYRPGSLEKLDIQGLDTYRKILLLRTLITVCSKAERHLIPSESYLIEPELIYSQGGRVTEDDIRILFYPDVKRMTLSRKLILFSDRICDRNRREERELFTKVRQSLEAGDINRAVLFLDKTILRMESRIYSVRAS